MEYLSQPSICPSFLISIPLIGALVVFTIPTTWERVLEGDEVAYSPSASSTPSLTSQIEGSKSKRFPLVFFVGLIFSLITFIISLLFWIQFDRSTSGFQFVEIWPLQPATNINFILGVDGYSLFLIILTTFLIPFCILCSWTTIKKHQKEYIAALLILESLMIAVFSILDLLLFYVFFESVLIPMFLIIGIWGSRERRIFAAYQFFLYTLLGSLFMLLAILLIYFQVGTTDLQVLYSQEFGERRQYILWLAFFASFAVKVPMVPVHLWLPEAHVEAPTAGSVILAGVLLKLGTYGFLRYSIPMFPDASNYFTPFIYTLSVIAIVYTSLTTIRQVDLKKIIAYSSVAHMNFVTIGLFSNNLQGIEGSIILMLSHGLVSSALFLCVGALYDRHKTRNIKYYGGLVQAAPILSSIMLFFTLANMSLPGTSSFVGEFLVLLSAFERNTFIATLAALGMILGAAYSLWYYNRVVFGNFKLASINTLADLNRREVCIFLPFLVGVLCMGIYPEIFLDCMHASGLTF